MGARQRTGPGVVSGPGQPRYGLSGLGEGDGEAERFHAARPSLRWDG